MNVSRGISTHTLRWLKLKQEFHISLLKYINPDWNWNNNFDILRLYKYDVEKIYIFSTFIHIDLRSVTNS